MPIKHWDRRFSFDYTAWAYAVFSKRCDSNMTVTEMAGRCGVSHTTMIHIEGGHWVSLPTIILISDILDITLINFVKR
jgi:DNA-binding XRE family transcriptional regulator